VLHYAILRGWHLGTFASRFLFVFVLGVMDNGKNGACPSGRQFKAITEDGAMATATCPRCNRPLTLPDCHGQTAEVQCDKCSGRVFLAAQSPSPPNGGAGTVPIAPSRPIWFDHPLWKDGPPPVKVPATGANDPPRPNTHVAIDWQGFFVKNWKFCVVAALAFSAIYVLGSKINTPETTKETDRPFPHAAKVPAPVAISVARQQLNGPAAVADGMRVSNVFFENPKPKVGETYSLIVVVENSTRYPTREVYTEVEIMQLPSGDHVFGSHLQGEWVGPGSYTFRFAIQCGVQGGTVTYAARFR
jgi:DNA-directed RNA polymerase subunit RPC12/RpoP